jgi:hypothetical protein
LKANIPNLGISYNPELVGTIGFQVPHLIDDPDFPVKPKDLWPVILAVMHKLSAVAYHLKNYQRLEDEKFELLECQSGNSPNEELELIHELEACLIQIKSSLDMLIKILDQLIGKNIVSTQTFSKSGKALINALNQYKNKSGVDGDSVDRLIGLVETAKSEWIDDAIVARDTINHFESHTYHFFARDSFSGDFLKTQFRGRPAVDYLTFTANMNLKFCQDFLCFAFAIPMASTKKLVPSLATKDIQIKWCWENCKSELHEK